MANIEDESGASSPLSSPPMSPLTEFSRSPTPPSEAESMTHLAHLRRHSNPYPSPPASQQTSHSSSPAPDAMNTLPTADQDGPPPAKRRRISKERSTEYLDLTSDHIRADQVPQFNHLLRVLRRCKKIVVVAGAGISVAAGIPDFRSSAGLFRSLKDDYKLKGTGKDLFDASVYKDDATTSTFHHMVSNMSQMSKDAKPTAFHHMLATIAKEGRLLRLYSQNVDGLETSLEPLSTCIPLRKEQDGKWPRTVQLHGGLTKMVCSKCHDLSDLDASLFEGPVPPLCPRCEEIDDIRTTHEGKRSHGIGRLRPRMVLYNEHNPDDEAIGDVTREDLRRRPDAIIVVGTTLKVPGVRRIVREMCSTVRDRRAGTSIWINNDLPPPAKDLENCWDIIVQGPCDNVANHAAMRKWDELMFAEINEEEFKRGAEKTAHVQLPWPELPISHANYEPLPSERHMNNSFRPPSPNKPVLTPLDRSPEWSPVPSRRTSVFPSIEQDAGDDGKAAMDCENIIVGSVPVTPSKSRRNSPTKKPEMASFPVSKVKAEPASKAAKKAAPVKRKTVKYIKTQKPQQSQSKSKSNPKVKSQAGPKSTSLTNTFKHSKNARIVGKELKDASSRSSSTGVSAVEPMVPVPPQDHRNNPLFLVDQRVQSALITGHGHEENHIMAKTRRVMSMGNFVN